MYTVLYVNYMMIKLKGRKKVGAGATLETT